MDDEEAMEKFLMDIKSSERLWLLPVDLGPGLLYLGDGTLLGHAQGARLSDEFDEGVIVLEDILDAEVIGE